jgi:hypothetical protein
MRLIMLPSTHQRGRACWRARAGWVVGNPSDWGINGQKPNALVVLSSVVGGLVVGDNLGS